MPRKKEWYICFISLINIWNLLDTFALFYVEHFQIILTCTDQPKYAAHRPNAIYAAARVVNVTQLGRQTYEDQYQTLESQTENILPVSLTVSLSIQLMTTFKPSLGIQSKLVVGVGGFISNFPPWNYCMGATNVVSAMSAIMYAQRCQRSAVHAMHAAYQSMHYIHFELVRVKSMEIDPIDLTRTSSKWICFGYWARAC